MKNKSVYDKLNTTTKNACEFCLIPITKTTSYFKTMHGKLPHLLNVPEIPEGFSVLQDLIPIAEKGGHLLIMPNKHYISLAIVEDQKKIAFIRDKIVQHLNKHFPKEEIFAFEHGPGFITNEQISCGGCHLDHAHGHIMVLPANTKFSEIKFKVEEKLSSYGWVNPSKNAVSSKEVFTNISKYTGIKPYLHIGLFHKDNTQVSYTYIQESKAWEIPSQLLRTIVSEIAYNQKSSTYWHWKDIHIGLSSYERIERIKKEALEFRKITGF